MDGEMNTPAATPAAPETPATPAETPTTTETPTPPTETPTDGEIPVAVATKPSEGEKPTEQPAAPVEINEEDYATKVTLEETIAKDVEVDQGAMRAVAPILKEAGVSVETAGKLVNALARYQIEQFKTRNQARFDDNKRMHDEALRKYSNSDFEQINSGIDAAFKPDGVMNYIVRNSEIGNDPEFLELMKWYGAHKPTNTQPTAGSPGGGTTGQSAGYAGISAAWN